MRSLKSLTTTGTGLVLLTVVIVCVNIIAAKLSVRFDVTEEKVFSLSEGTHRILAKLDEAGTDVTARLYFSRSLKELPPPVKTYASRVEEVLREYQERSNGRLKVEVLDPKPDTDEEEWAQRYGVTGVRLPSGDQMYFGVVLLAGSKEIPLPYLDPRREEFLEYDLSEALVGTLKKDRAKIGVLSSYPVMGGVGGQPWVLVSDLRRTFTVEAVSPGATEIPADLRVLLVIHPKGLSEGTLYAIDQFVVGGGRVIVAVDPMSRLDLQAEGAQARAGGQMPNFSSNLDRLLAAWGVAYDPETLVGDVGLATQINAGGQVVAYPYFMSLGEPQLDRQSVITANLKQILYAEGGALAHVGDDKEKDKDGGYTFEPLIRSTKDSGTASKQLAAFMSPDDLARQLKRDEQERVLAALVRGKFKSAFAGPPAGVDGSKRPHQSEAQQESQVLVIADSDFLFDGNAVETFRFGSQVMVRPRNDNLSFVVNAADYLGGSEDLIAIRSRGRIARPFTRVADLQRDAQKKWQAEEEVLTTQLSDLQKKLSEIQQQRTDGNRFVLSQAQQGEIAKFREEERQIRRRRREVRKNLREDIEALGRRLTLVNLSVVPFAAAGLGAFVFVRRGRQRKEHRHGK